MSDLIEAAAVRLVQRHPVDGKRLRAEGKYLSPQFRRSTWQVQPERPTSEPPL